MHIIEIPVPKEEQKTEIVYHILCFLLLLLLVSRRKIFPSKGLTNIDFKCSI